MLNSSLPIYIDPRKYANHEMALEGQISLNQLKELCAALASDVGEVAVHLNFKVDEDRRYIATGNLKTQVQLICQRCMEPTPYDVEIELALAFVYDEDHAKNISVDFDPVVMTEGEIVLAKMIEEELLLALPVVAYHDQSGCNPIALKYASSTDDAPDDEENPNPFSILAQLKAKS